MSTNVRRAFIEYQAGQLYVLPPDPREWLPEGHLAFFVGEVVDELDLAEIWQAYEGSGRARPAYYPPMMVKVLVYAYCVGVFSSRVIARRLHEDVAFRVLAAGNMPDFRTIAKFRRQHLPALERLFIQVLELCRKAGLVRLGHVALDGTKIDANASKHKAMSYGRMVEREADLQKEISELLNRAEATDAAEDAQYGNADRIDIPEELKRRETRLAKIREAKAALEAEHAAKTAAETAQPDPDGDDGGSGGKGHKPKDSGPAATTQRNFTDPDSRIMKNSDKAWRQSYNGQAAVDAEHQIIVAVAVTQDANDQRQIEPMVALMKDNLGRLPDNLSADTGYCSEANLGFLAGQPIEAYVATAKDRHGKDSNPRTIDRTKSPQTATMQERLATPEGAAQYRLRKQTVEPVFGQIKGVRGFRRFSLRGLNRARGEWALVCACHNLLKLWRASRRAA